MMILNTSNQIKDTTNVAIAAAAATTVREQLQKARTSATAVPTLAVSKLPVEKNTAGNVIALSTAYGT